MMRNKPKDIDSYLDSVPETHQASLKKLRAQIKKNYPKATEHISYSVPLFKLDDHPLAGFAAHKSHSSLFVWSGTVLKTLGKKLKGYDTTLSTIRFLPDQALPEPLVRAVLNARAKEIKKRWGKKVQ